MGDQSVTVHGKEFKVMEYHKGYLSLNLSRMNIKDISEIEGLDSLTNLWFFRSLL